MPLFAEDIERVAWTGAPLRGHPNPREHAPVTAGARGQPDPGDAGEYTGASERRVHGRNGLSGARSARSWKHDWGLGLADVPAGRAVLHKSADSAWSEVPIRLSNGEADLAEGKTPIRRKALRTWRLRRRSRTGDALARGSDDGSVLDSGTSGAVTGFSGERI